VHVAVRRANHLEGAAAIGRAEGAGVVYVNGIGALGVGEDVGVIPGALAEIVVGIGAGPGAAAVVGAENAAVAASGERESLLSRDFYDLPDIPLGD
jgi:hypothetical protein